MKIALSIASDDITGQVDPRFGRCPYLVVLDRETNSVNIYPNPGINASGGAGIKAAQFLSDLQVEVVVSGEFGPNAYQALNAAGIRLYRYGDCQSIEETLTCLDAGQLERYDKPTHTQRYPA